MKSKQKYAKGSRDTDCNDTEVTTSQDSKSKGHSKGVKPAS